MTDYDAVVVGGSIGGCTAATLLARQGARVAIVERHADPDFYKALCTHFIQASATPTIERLGLTQPIEAAGGVRNGLEFWSRAGWVRPNPGEDYPYPRYGYDIRREKLDPMLRELAAGTDGVELLLGETATAVLRDNGRPAGVRIRDRSGVQRTIRARVVVGADGRDSHTARLAGVPARVKPHGRFGYYAYYKNLPLVSGDRTLFWFLDPDVVYAFPQDDGLTLLAVFQTKDRASWFKRDLQANLEAAFRGLPNAPDIAKAQRVSKIMGRLEVPNTMRPAGQPGLAFVGDAALAADPLWGVGCGFAFQSGEWLAEELGGALGTDASADAALDRYRKRHRRMLMGHQLMMSDYATGRRLSGVEKLIFSSAAKDRKLAEGFFAYVSRAITAQDPSFGRNLARAIKVALTRRNGADREPATGQYAEGAGLPAGVTRGRISAAGISTPVSSVGDEDASEAIVFVHGNPGSSRDWDDLLA